jgi:hypothetical protein
MISPRDLPISPRYVPAICVIGALALVPTVIHSYVGARVDDDRRASAIPVMLAGHIGTPTERDAGWGSRAFDSHDWVERRYTASNREVILTVVRSYDLKQLYHHPELFVAYGTPFVDHQTHRFAAAPHIPVHVLRTAEARGSVALYVLHYDEGFVEDPIWFQIRTAGALLFGGRKPMTLIFARAPSVPESTPLETMAAGQVLLEAIDGFVRSGSPGGQRSAAEPPAARPRADRAPAP